MATAAPRSFSIGSSGPSTRPQSLEYWSRVQYQDWAAQARRQGMTFGWKSNSSIRARCASTRPRAVRLRRPSWWATNSVCRTCSLPATRNRMSERPRGRARQIWASCNPMRWPTARAVSSSGPISAAMAMTVGTTSFRQAASGAPPCLLVGTITEGRVYLSACELFVSRLTIYVVTGMLGAIRNGLQGRRNKPRRYPAATLRRSQLSSIKHAVFVAGGVLLSATCALAGPTYTFSTSEGTQPFNVGTITLSQINETTVDVLVDLSDTTLPGPQYGFINTGGPHTPFAFTLAGTESGVSATFLQPGGGNYSFGVFSLSTAGGEATPYGR